MKLQTKKVFFVGLAFLIICLFWQVYDSIIAKMLINTFGLNQTWSGVVMALDNVLALVLLPVFGALSDKTKTKYGKRTPYIFFGVIISAIFLVGVSLFDNLQMNRLEDNNAGYVVEVNSNLLNESNEYNSLLDGLTQEQVDEILENHTGDYWYANDLSEEEVAKLVDYDRQASIASNIDKYYSLVDIEISEAKFKELCDLYLSSEERQQYKYLIDDMSHEKRVEVTITAEKGLLDKIFGKEAVTKGVRANQDAIDDLNKLLAENIAESFENNTEGLKTLLNSIGIRKFSNFLSWRFAFR